MLIGRHTPHCTREVPDSTRGLTEVIPTNVKSIHFLRGTRCISGRLALSGKEKLSGGYCKVYWSGTCIKQGDYDMLKDSLVSVPGAGKCHHQIGIGAVSPTGGSVAETNCQDSEKRKTYL